MDHLRHPAVHKLRTIVFGYSLLFRGGFQSRNDFAIWCDRWWLTRHPFTPQASKPNAKWFALLKGAWPRCAAELIEDFPFLAHVLDDPLWTVLDWEDNAADLAEGLVRRLRLNGAPLLPFSHVGMETLCGCPDWTRLAYLVALLRTRAPEYFFHRLWLQKNFSCYLQLVCLTQPCCACCEHLYRHLHAHYLLGRLGAVDHWPRNIEWFHIALEQQESQWDALAAMNWFHERDSFSITMLWCVAAAHELLLPRFAQGHYDCPRGLWRRVHDTLASHAKTRITLVD
ncbi:hypothetical protein [Pseudomonas jessenii]|uniref:hypothetical protein n=1 Tax=Pseudomonas jessenii TaxID=77298 RepID=UPI000F952EA4